MTDLMIEKAQDWAVNQGIVGVGDCPNPTKSVTSAGQAAAAHPAGVDATVDGVTLPSGDVTISACARTLFQRIAPSNRLFLRGGAIMEIAQGHDGSLGLDIVTASAFRSRIKGFGSLWSWRSGGNMGMVLKPTTCSEDTAKALMATDEARDRLPRVSTIVACPVLIEAGGGLIALEKGYHLEHGGIFVSAEKTPPVITLEEAVPAIAGLVDETKFQSRSDRSRALANMITPALKMGGLLRGFVPADVAEADLSQAGKTYRQRVLAAVYNEVPAPIAVRKGGVGSADESLAHALVTGRPFIQFDNLRGKLDSTYLEALLTAQKVFSARVPHRGEIQVDPSRFFIMLTSNGVETTEDMANRSSIVRIRKQPKKDYKKFAEGDLLDHVKANSSYYLGCVFTIIKEWHAKGKPRSTTTDHDFREWAQVLDWIVQMVLREAPLLEGHRTAQVRVATPAMQFLRALALAVRARNRLSVYLSATNLAELCDDAGIEIPGLKSTHEEAARKQIGIQMGKALLGKGSVEIEDFAVLRQERTEQRPFGGDFKSRTYAFIENPQNRAQLLLEFEKLG